MRDSVLSARRLAIAGAVLIVAGILPLTTMIGADWMAWRFGCPLGESDRPCRLFGHDLTGIQYALLGLAPVAVGSLCLVPVGLAFLLAALANWRPYG